VGKIAAQTAGRQHDSLCYAYPRGSERKNAQPYDRWPDQGWDEGPHHREFRWSKDDFAAVHYATWDKGATIHCEAAIYAPANKQFADPSVMHKLMRRICASIKIDNIEGRHDASEF
jgi:hypothetical protein